MKKIVLLMFSTILVFTACNGNSQSKSISKDSMHENAIDSSAYNPAVPSAQNSDDPNRFSQ